MSDRVTYRIDEHDCLTNVGGEWDTFAHQNGAPHLLHGVIGRSIWDFVSGDLTRYVYQELLARVRAGRPVAFEYRCDAPRLRRDMWMTVTAGQQGIVEFDSQTLRTVPREAYPRATPREPIDHLVPMCSWCKNVAIGNTWYELDTAIVRLGIFVEQEPPLMTHTVCGSCLDRVLGSLKK